MLNDKKYCDKQQIVFQILSESIHFDFVVGVLHLITTDKLISIFARHQIFRKPDSLSWSETNNVRSKLRFLGRLLKGLHDQTATKLPFVDLLKPSFFDAFRLTVLKIRTENKQAAFTLGPCIRKLCLLNISDAIKHGDKARREYSKDFLDLYNAEWTETVSSSTIRMQQDAKVNRKVLLPLAADLDKLTKYIEKEMQHKQVFTRLQKLVMTWLILFNKRRPAEVAGLLIDEYRLSFDNEEDREEILHSLTAEERAVAAR